MVCRTETSIERAAIHLLQAGWCAGAEESAAPEDLRPLVSHAEGCVRCRELLEIFLETERRLRQMVAGDLSGDEAHLATLTDRVLALVPLPEGPDRSKSSAAEGSGPTSAGDARASDGRDMATAGEEPESYDLAADAGERREAEAPTQSRTLTLVTEDDRYLVRIVAAETGGARAVLVQFPTEGSAERAPDPRPSLRIGDTEYVFDESGVLELPVFPGSSVFLVLR
jgi:hypothetical protein